MTPERIIELIEDCFAALKVEPCPFNKKDEKFFERAQEKINKDGRLTPNQINLLKRLWRKVN